MSAHAAPAPGGLTLTIRGRPYPVLLPKLRDPRLHLAATITSLQVLGQVAFGFRLSIAQILISLVTCAVLEVGIAAWRQHVILWPASALLTGNGVAFILRVPGTRHGDWWSTRGWWIFASVAAVSLLSKHVVQWRGGHVFNPSNFGLVLCFLVLGRSRVEPLDFWWGPMSPWMALALAIILAGGFTILSRLRLLWIALAFWAAFAGGIAVLALSGHDMTARWHLGPVTGFHFWWVLLTSPEVLVFLFFMITDPKTAPKEPRARIAYGAAIGLLGALLIAPTSTEWASKVALLSSLFVVCAVLPIVAYVPRRRLVLAAAGAAAAYPVALLLLGSGPGAASARVLPAGHLPPIEILPSRGVQSQLTMPTARLVAHDLLVSVPAHQGERLRLHLEPGGGQDPPVAVAELAGRTYRLKQVDNRWALASGAPPREPALASGPVIGPVRLTDVAAQAGIVFRQGSFRFGVTNDEPAMMGGGLCWLDYDGDGWLDLFVVNSYTDSQLPDWEAAGGLPTSALFHNDHGRFTNVSKRAGAALPLRGEGCVAADLDGDGHTDLFVSTATSDELLWNDGDGTFSRDERRSGIVSFGWHAGAAVTDVNRDGRLDLFVAGYADAQHPISGSTEGFPRNYPGVRDLLFLNEGGRRFREAGAAAGLDRAPFDHSLGAVFGDFDDDGHSDLYVANDEDPNRLYLWRLGGPLGFHFVERGAPAGVADPNAGMGVAWAEGYLFVSNSRRQQHAVYLHEGAEFTSLRRAFAPAFGTNLTGWGDAWVDFDNDGHDELVVANGAIPVKSLRKDAAPPQVLVSRNGRWTDTRLLRDVRVNGRGLAAADYDNDGRVDLAVNTVGGTLLLLRNTTPVRTGHWLEVSVVPASPGARVSIVTRAGGQAREVQAGSSYLSSEDPRVHFGLGGGEVTELTVRFPDGKVRRLRHVERDRLVVVRHP